MSIQTLHQSFNDMIIKANPAGSSTHSSDAAWRRKILALIRLLISGSENGLFDIRVLTLLGLLAFRVKTGSIVRHRSLCDS